WDLLNILALEADRAGAYVLGEDLGTVEDEVRAELAERRVMSYRLLWFEPEQPEAWPSLALGAVTTHDLPTVAGVWTGSDLEAQRAAGLEPNEAAFLALRYRLGEWTGCSDGTPVAEVIARAYSLVAESPCAVVAATLEDVSGAEERPNMPGTPGLSADGKGWPNWSRALPLPLEELERSELAGRVAAELSVRSHRSGG
ncbi:MAG: 4-alpha-glucanotransferase, partial [Acidimicrobiales bacterium]